MPTLQILGASCAVPNPGCATSSYLLRDGSFTILIDCGHGAVATLSKYADPADLDAVIISHMHPDHCIDLIALRNYVYVNKLPKLRLLLPVNGRQTLRGVAVGLQLHADYFDDAFAIETYTPDRAPALGPVRFRAIRTRHNTVCHALRFELTSGKALAYSSDTAWFAELGEFAAGADILLLECTDPRTPDTARRWHLCPRDAVRVLEAAAPALTLITHYAAENAEAILASVLEAQPGLSVKLAYEGDSYAL